MAKLIVNPTSPSRREIALNRSLISIGRDPSNDVVLPDAMVSRRHAVIEYRGSQYFVRDCNSSNGSLVNGDRVSERSLRDGDLVAIGTARLLFREDLVLEDAGSKVVQHPSAPRLHCPTCQADYRKGDLFCKQCGTTVGTPAAAKAVCSSCGTVVPLPARFCNACGHELPESGVMAAAVAPVKPEPEPDPGPGPAPRDIPPADPLPLPPPPVIPREVRPQPRASASSSTSRAGGAEPARPLSPPPAAPPAPPPGLRAVAGPRPARTEEGQYPSEITGAVADPVPVGTRLLAGLVDFVIVSAIQSVLLAPAFYYWWVREIPVRPADVSFLPIVLSLGLVPVVIALGVAYYVYYWGVRGATPGKQLLGLAVAGEDGAVPIGVSRATVRALGYLLSGLLLGLGFLMILFGGTGLHDRLAGTRVVRQPNPSVGGRGRERG
jgi:uncharacterized RDD family membrane protein YckC